MPVPVAPTFAPSILIAANTLFRDAIDGGGAAGFVRIRSAADVLLAQVPLTLPCGVVDGTTGALTITPAGRDDAAAAGGAAAYAEICSGAGVVLLSIPTTVGVAPQRGYLVINNVAIMQGAPVELLQILLS